MKEPFHWDLNDCVELGGSHVSRDGEHNSDDDDIQVEENQQRNQSTARNNYRYNLNTFLDVSVQEEDTNSKFWLTKINKVIL